MSKGGIVIGDPVSQYLATLKPGDNPKIAVEARESQGLRAIYLLINGVGEVESLLDSGSQIISMAKLVAQKLEISWDPDITIEMESANRSLERTLGLAKNVPLACGSITVYLQIHIMSNPAYKVLLGRPFDSITESLVKNERDRSQTLTLTDPNTGERCEMHTYERGKVPEILKRAVDRSVTRLYAEIPLFTHSTTIALSPFEAKPRERFRAYPSVSERFRAFRNFLTIPFTIAARAAHTSPIDITFRHNSFSNMKSTLPNISEHSLLIAPESHSGISFFLSNSFLLVSRKAPLLVK